MSTVTYAQYVIHTGDSTTASATVEANLDIAEQAVEDFLRRELASVERTEEIRVFPNGYVYPKNVPVTSVQASADYSVHNEASIKYVTPDSLTSEVVGWARPAAADYPHDRPYATVTYVGGWSATTMPVAIVRVVCLVAKALSVPGTIPQAGVEQASVGDVSVKYTAGATSGHLVDALVPGSSVMLTGYRWRPL